MILAGQLLSTNLIFGTWSRHGWQCNDAGRCYKNMHIAIWHNSQHVVVGQGRVGRSRNFLWEMTLVRENLFAIDVWPTNFQKVMDNVRYHKQGRSSKVKTRHIRYECTSCKLRILRIAMRNSAHQLSDDCILILWYTRGM